MVNDIEEVLQIELNAIAPHDFEFYIDHLIEMKMDSSKLVISGAGSLAKLEKTLIIFTL